MSRRTAERATGIAPQHWLVIPLISLLWGMNMPTLGVALRELPPWTLRAATLGGAGLVLLVISLARRESLRIRRSDWPCLLAFTLLFIVIQNVLISFAQLSVTTGRIGVMTFTMPIWTTLLAAVFLHEPLNGERKAGLVLGTLGLLALVIPAIQHDGHVGWFLAAGSAWCWAVATILIKRFPISASPLAVTTWQLLIGGACVTVGMFVVDGSPFHRSVSDAVLAAVIYNVASQSITQVLWYQALMRLPAALAALGVLVVPTITMLGSAYLLDQSPTPLDCVGLLFITCASASVQIPWNKAWRKLRNLPTAG